MAERVIRVGMVGLGMIVDETYLPAFRQRCGPVTFAAAASRTGRRGEKLLGEWPTLANFAGADSVPQMLRAGVDAVCVATPDDRHFEPARLALEAGKHVLIEKPSVLSLAELDELTALAERNGVLAKVVYHKLLDPDHKKLRTHVADGVLRHVNNGYCSLLEPKSISGGQFAEWITGRNPATYVAVHYLKLIDFTFGPDWTLSRVTATGQRGLVGPADGPTWDSVQSQVVYTHPDGREAAFDVHTSWVTPDDFPGTSSRVPGSNSTTRVWNAHQRKRGVEVCVEGKTPHAMKNTPNHHYNGTFLEPWGERSQRGYGIEAVSRFFDEVAHVEHSGPAGEREQRLRAVRGLAYNDLTADRNVVATVQAIEAILAAHASGRPGSVVRANGSGGGLVQWFPGEREPAVLYAGRV
ncbi:MAG: Gfo/Idh/MocA family oxidoreductase [Gemmataceae bacterium]